MNNRNETTQKFQLVAARSRLLSAMLEKTQSSIYIHEFSNPDDEDWADVMGEVQQHWNTAAVALNDLCSAYEDLATAVKG